MSRTGTKQEVEWNVEGFNQPHTIEERAMTRCTQRRDTDYGQCQKEQNRIEQNRIEQKEQDEIGKNKKNTQHHVKEMKYSIDSKNMISIIF